MTLFAVLEKHSSDKEDTKSVVSLLVEDQQQEVETDEEDKALLAE